MPKEPVSRDTLSRRRGFIINTLYFAIILAIVILITRYAIPEVLAFVIALVVSVVIRPVVDFMQGKMRISRNLATITTVLIFYALIAGLLTFIGFRVVALTKSLLSQAPSFYNNTIVPGLNSLDGWLEATVTDILPEEADYEYQSVIPQVITELGTWIKTASVSAVKLLGNTAVSIPSLLLNVIFCIVSTYFFTADWGLIKGFIVAQLTEQTHTIVHEAKEHLRVTLWRFIRSYFIIMVMTFGEIELGLLILGQKSSVAIAAIIAIFDILPVVGSGMVLAPWGIIALIQGNTFKGVGLLVLLAIVAVVRNIAEPRIIGEHVGLHPLVTLVAMIVGTAVFGPIGLLGLPVAIAVIMSLNDAGIVHIFEPYDTPEAKPSLTARLFNRLFRHKKHKELKNESD